MPQDSIPPELPSEQDLAEEIEAEPLVYDRHAEVRHVLQDVVLFAQDFIDILDDLAEEPIVPQEIFFDRADRPAGRFLGPGRQNPNIRVPAGQPYNMRPGMMGRRRAGGNFRQPQPRVIIRRPPRLMDRRLRRAGNLREPVRPVQPPADIPREQISGGESIEGPDNVDEPREVPAPGEEEPIRPAVEEAGQDMPAVEEAGQDMSAVAEAGQDMPAVAEAGQDVSAVEGENNMAMIMLAEAACSVASRRETGRLHRPTPYEGNSSPEQVKRARLDVAEAGCSEQSTEKGSDDDPMEVS